MPTITIGATTIPYTIEERPRRQHPAIQIDASRQVTVLVPSQFDVQQVEPLLNRKARWLLKHLTASPTPYITHSKEFVSGEGFLLRGHPLRLKVQQNNTMEPSAIVEGRALRVTIPALALAQQPFPVRELLIQWYTQQAETLFPERINHYAPMVGIHPTRLKIAEYKSRWGFAGRTG